jgi:hypothetical protein
MRKVSLALRGHIAIAIATLTFIGLCVSIDESMAKDVVLGGSTWSKDGLQRQCQIIGGNYNVESNGSFSCTNSNTGLATQCNKSGKCLNVCQTSKCGNGRTTTRGDGSKIDQTTLNGGGANTPHPSGTTKSNGAGNTTSTGAGSGAVGATSGKSGVATSAPNSTLKNGTVGGSGRPLASPGSGGGKTKEK